MYELVEMRDNDIFTTSKIIADGTNIMQLDRLFKI